MAANTLRLAIAVADVLADCQTPISRRMGRAGVLGVEAHGFELIPTEQENVEIALEEYRRAL